eukprot:5841768-Pyramimonas_sp.AAC.1
MKKCELDWGESTLIDKATGDYFGLPPLSLAAPQGEGAVAAAAEEAQAVEAEEAQAVEAEEAITA